MSDAASSSAASSSMMGPALFLGLSAYVMITQPDPENGYLNPVQEMDLLALAQTLLPDQTQTGEHSKAPPPPISQRPQADRAYASLNFATASPSAVRIAPPLTPFRVAIDVPDQTLRPTTTTIEESPTATRWRDSDPDITETTLQTQGIDPPPANLPVLVWLQVTGDDVHLRPAPSLQSSPFAKMNRTDIGLRLSEQGNWIQMKFPQLTGETTGWMWKPYLAPADRQNSDN